MSVQWTNIELRTTPLRLVREHAADDELRRRQRRLIRNEMIKPAIVGGSIIAGFLMQAAGIHWEAVIASAITAMSVLLLAAGREYLKNRKETKGASTRTSAAIAELDFKERERIDAKQEQFIEMVRDLHAQQTSNMQAIIENQKAIIENQKESMKLKDIEMDKRAVQITEMQNELLKGTQR